MRLLSCAPGCPRYDKRYLYFGKMLKWKIMAIKIQWVQPVEVWGQVTCWFICHICIMCTYNTDWKCHLVCLVYSMYSTQNHHKFNLKLNWFKYAVKPWHWPVWTLLCPNVSALLYLNIWFYIALPTCNCSGYDLSLLSWKQCRDKAKCDERLGLDRPRV